MNSNNLQSFVVNKIIEYTTSEKSYKELYEELHIKHKQYKSNVKRTCDTGVCVCGCVNKSGQTCCLCWKSICNDCTYGCDTCGVACEKCYTELFHDGVNHIKCEDCDCYI
jgi:hypothetical protein